MTTVDGNALAGASATTRWTVHNRATEAKGADGVRDDRCAVKVFGFFRSVDYGHGMFGSS